MPRPHFYHPETDLLLALVEARRAGVPFEEAWAVALPMVQTGSDTATRRAWAEAFDWTREGWRRAYDGEPPTAAEEAVTRLVGPGNGRPRERAPVQAVAA